MSIILTIPPPKCPPMAAAAMKRNVNVTPTSHPVNATTTRAAADTHNAKKKVAL